MSEVSSIAKGTARPPLQYRVQGEGAQDFYLVALRDRIRDGTLLPENELMVVGTDLWKPAGQYPALTRYFNLLKRPVAVAVAAAGPAQSMGDRIAFGVAYPFSSPASIALIAASFIAGLVLPLLSLIVSLVASIYALGIIRTSSEGQTSSPSFSELGGPLEWIAGLLRLIALTLLSLWPFLLAAFISLSGLAALLKFLLAGVIVVLYYPATLATVAIWKSLKMALSVQQIFRFIGVLGGDYYAVIAMWFASFVAVGMMMNLSGRVLPAMLVGAIKGTASIFVTMYASHLLGWAVHRHRGEL